MRSITLFLIACFYTQFSWAVQSGFSGFSPFGDIHWKAPVTAVGTLPAVGNLVGDTRIETTAFGIYTWNGSAWVASGGGTGITQLTGNVTAGPGSGSQAATVVSVGGSSAANVHSAELLANAATSSNTNSTIVKRDSSGNFSATIITAALSGNSTTATALASNPTDCGANTFATTIDAQGNLTCSSIPNAATTATSANTASTIVARDGSGNFSAGTITAALTGNATNVTGVVAIANGGSGQSTKTTAFNALSPLSTLGDIIYHNGTDNVRLAGNTTAAKNFLVQTGNGTISAAPLWDLIATADLPTIPINKGGTGQTTNTLGFNALSPLTTVGDLIGFNGTNNVRLPVGSDGQLLSADSGQTTGLKWITQTEDVFRANKTGTQSLCSGSATQVTYDVTDYDTLTQWNSGTSTYTASVTGYYHIGMALRTMSTAPWNGTSVTQLLLYINGSFAVLLYQFVPPNGVQDVFDAGATDYLLTAGDTVKFYALGNNADCAVSSGTQASNYVYIHRIR